MGPPLLNSRQISIENPESRTLKTIIKVFQITDAEIALLLTSNHKSDRELGELYIECKALISNIRSVPDLEKEN